MPKPSKNDTPETEIEIEVFKTGTITDSSGDTKTWTPEDLQIIVNNYNEKLIADPGIEAPITKGHEPKSGEQAYGWVRALKVVGDKIKANISLVGDFAEEVSKELYKKCSIGLDEDLLLKHIAFLGAEHPAVKGLAPITLSEVKYRMFYFAETGTISNSPSLTQTIDELKAEKQVIIARMLTAAQTLGFDLTKDRMYFSEGDTTFSVALNDNLKQEKPTAYAEHTDADFGDPTHFKFPLKTKSEVRASMAIFSKPNVAGQYSEAEQQYIASRIILAAKANNIQLTPKTWAYAEVNIPVEVLSRKQLESYINSLINIDNNKFISNNNSKGKTMNDWISGLITYMTQWLADSVNQETATQFQGKYDEYLTTSPMPAEAPPAVAASEPVTPAVPNEYAERITSLEKENRLMKHEQYFSEQVKGGKLLPAQKDVIMSALEATQTVKSFEFSEGIKKVTVEGEGVIKKIIASYPKLVEFAELAKKDNADAQKKTTDFSAPAGLTVNEDALDNHGKILKYQAEMTAKGTAISYEVAAAHIMSTINN